MGTRPRVAYHVGQSLWAAGTQHGAQESYAQTGKELPNNRRVARITQTCNEKGKIAGDTEREVLLFLCLIFCPPRLGAKGLGLNPDCSIDQL